MQGIRLDDETLEVQLNQKLFPLSPFVVIPRSMAGLANRHTQLRRVDGHMGNARRPPSGDGFYRPAYDFPSQI
jgi:hypothetical protein